MGATQKLRDPQWVTRERESRESSVTARSLASEKGG